MNIHYLELFYYVARYGGISQAVRHMPYGIQQPAISQQILQLEDDLGAKLFDRRPFHLTAAGQKLYDFAHPFFDRIDEISEEIRGKAIQHIRIGSPEIIMQNHLPPLLERIRARFPQLRLTLKSGYQNELEEWLLEQQIDLAVTVLASQPASQIHYIKLLDVPLVLMVHKKSPLQSAEELWSLDKIETSLICLPTSEPISRHFQEGLTRLGIDWLPSIEASSLESIKNFTVNGYGIGLNAWLPQEKAPKDVRILPLKDFKPVELAVLWIRDPNPIMQSFLDEIQAQASQLKTTLANNIK